MDENSLPICCKDATWIIRNSARRQREVMRRGYSSLPKIAVCSKCGNVKFIDPGLPDEEFLRRRNARRNRSQQNSEEEK